MKQQNLIFTNNVAQEIDRLAPTAGQPGPLVLVDANTASFVLPRLQADSAAMATAKVITIKAGDINKNLDTLASIWKQLGDNGATRHSMLINLGGGVVTDIGGFAAATFKRGITAVNVPTTLLGAVDAAVGGKTGINFNGLKNEIGAFSPASTVIISTCFFDTLPQRELLSGYAEMLKHAIIDGPETYAKLLDYSVSADDPDRLLDLLRHSVNVKARIVETDPTETGLRRALNLGHTVGHAFESLAMRRQSPEPHGYAVAWGLVAAMVVSHLQLKFPARELQRLADYVNDHYGAFAITCDDYHELLRLMHHDKKNVNSETINMTLLKGIGQVAIDQAVTDDTIKTALDIYRDLMHI